MVAANLLIGPIFSSLDNQFRRIDLLLLRIVSYHKSSKELRIGSRFWLLTGVYNSVVRILVWIKILSSKFSPFRTWARFIGLL